MRILRRLILKPHTDKYVLFFGGREFQTDDQENAKLSLYISTRVRGKICYLIHIEQVLYLQALPDEFCSVQTGIQTCVEDVLSWINSNKLMLNTDKTEVKAVGTSSRLSRVDGNSANIGDSNIPFKTSVKYLGVKPDQILSIQYQRSSVCRASFLELRRLASIRPYLSE